MRKLEKKIYGHRAENIMKTYVKEKDDAYEMKEMCIRDRARTMPDFRENMNCMESPRISMKEKGFRRPRRRRGLQGACIPRGPPRPDGAYRRMGGARSCPEAAQGLRPWP